MSSPKVTIIIPTYNRARLIPTALESALRQAYDDYEIVVLDDGSTDGTGDIVRSMAPDARYIWQENVGIPEVLNRCVLAARGEYITFLGSDDALTENCVARQAAVLDANPGVGVVYGQAWVMDDAGKTLWRLRPSFAAGDYVRSGRREIADLLMSNHIPATTVMARRAAFDEAGLFDPRFGLYEDWNMWTRIFKTWDAAYIAEPLAYYRVHVGADGSIFQKADSRALARYRRMQIEEVLNDPEIGRLYRHLRGRAYARHHSAVAVHALGSGAAWYARLEALRSLASNPFGAFNPTGRGALRLLAKSFVPRPLWKAARRALRRSPPVPAETPSVPEGIGAAPGAEA